MSGGLHGVGVSVVNALSITLDLTIWRDGEEHYMQFSHGDAVAPLKVVGPARKKGTRVTFLPSPQTFKITEFDFEKLSIATANSPSSIWASACSSSMRAMRKRRKSNFIMKAASPRS